MGAPAPIRRKTKTPGRREESVSIAPVLAGAKAAKCMLVNKEPGKSHEEDSKPTVAGKMPGKSPGTTPVYRVKEKACS